MIIFLSTQDSVEFHQKLLSATVNPGEEEENESSVDIYKLYGDMPQKERMKIFNEFSLAKSGVLLCTVSLLYLCNYSIVIARRPRLMYIC